MTEKVSKSWVEYLPSPGRFLRILFWDWLPPKTFWMGLWYAWVLFHFWDVGFGLGRLPDRELLRQATADLVFLVGMWTLGVGAGVCHASYNQALRERP